MRKSLSHQAHADSNYSVCIKLWIKHAGAYIFVHQLWWAVEVCRVLYLSLDLLYTLTLILPSLFYFWIIGFLISRPKKPKQYKIYPSYKLLIFSSRIKIIQNECYCSLRQEQTHCLKTVLSCLFILWARFHLTDVCLIISQQHICSTFVVSAHECFALHKWIRQ